MNPEIIQPNQPVQPTEPPPPPPPSVPSTPLGGVPTAFASTPAADLPPVPKKNRKKLFIISGAALAAVLLITSAVVFGYYVPNKPANVYRTGMTRSGKALHGMVLGATTDEKLQQIKKSEISGSLDATFDKEPITGKFNVKLDPTKTNGSFETSYKLDGKDQKISAEFMTELQKNARFPDLFFRVNGIKSLTDNLVPAGGPDIGQYDNKWIAVEGKYLETLSGGFSAEAPKNRENISSQEIAQLIRAVSDVSNDYVFTSDSSKAVLENRSFVGKEKTAEGIESFRYKVGVNKDHAAAYCKALSNRVLSEPATRKIANMDQAAIDEAKKNVDKDCDDAAKDIKTDKTFDMWIDAKYKVIHKVRVYEQKDGKAYTDVGQIYTGGDKLALFVAYSDDSQKAHAKLTFDVDIPGSKSEGKLTADANNNDDWFGNFNLKAGVTAQPYSGELNVTKPAGAISIEEILKKFGYDPTYMSGVNQVEPSTPVDSR